MYQIRTKKRKNSRCFDKVVFKSESIQEIKDYLSEHSISVIGKPYIFTHINLTNNCIATCSYNGIICSPEELYEELTK